MRKYSDEQINYWREQFRKKGFQEVEENVCGKKFKYFVLPSSFVSELPNFVLRMTGDGKDYLLGVSEEVNPNYRKYAVAHEFIEFVELGDGVREKCCSALAEEIRLVPEEIKKDYLEMRRDFFKNLVSYCKKYPEDYTEEDIAQFERNASTLEKLLG